jgi:hypothetical protein
VINISKDIILCICGYVELGDVFNYGLSCEYVNGIITQYLYKNKHFFIINKSIYDSANYNI